MEILTRTDRPAQDLPFGADLLHQGTSQDDPTACINTIESGAIDDYPSEPAVEPGLPDGPTIPNTDPEPAPETDPEAAPDPDEPTSKAPFGAELLQEMSDTDALGILACVYGLSTQVDDDVVNTQVDDDTHGYAELDFVPRTSSETAPLN